MNVKVVGVITGEISSSQISSAKRYVDIVEIRADMLLDKVDRIIKRVKDFQKILTVRKVEEGGAFVKDRREIFLKYLNDVDFIDIESSSIKELEDIFYHAKAKRKKVIISYHNFEKINIKEIEKAFKLFEDIGGDIFKFAVFSTKFEDIPHIAEILRKLSQKAKVCGMIMGDSKVSFISRIVLPIFGSYLTYGFLGKIPSAPGQPNALQIGKILK